MSDTSGPIIHPVGAYRQHRSPTKRRALRNVYINMGIQGTGRLVPVCLLFVLPMLRISSECVAPNAYRLSK